MPFQDKYRSFIYVHDGAFEGEATAYDFTVSDSATPIGGFYASGASLAEVVLHNTSATNSILVKAKSGTVGTALNEYSGIYKLEPLESRKFIFGSDMFFALGNYVSGDTATVHISALNATVTEPTAPAEQGGHGPANILDGASYTFGPFTVVTDPWLAPFEGTASSGGGAIQFTVKDSGNNTYLSPATYPDLGAFSNDINNLDGAIPAGDTYTIIVAPTGCSLTAFSFTGVPSANVTEP